MLISGFMAIFPLVSNNNVELDSYANFFSKTASVYTGIVGVIIGYYFGRSDNNPPSQPKDNELPKQE